MSKKFLTSIQALDADFIGDVYIDGYLTGPHISIQGFAGTQGGSGLQGVQGFQGYIGGGLWTASDTPPTGMQLGDRWFNTTNGQEYTWLVDSNGSYQWVDTRTSGYIGIQGSEGFQGAVGVQGSQGLQGTQGLQGSTGIQGSVGIQGSTGFQGTQGLQGTQGTQGHTGTQGAQGTQGIQGIQGVQGMQGTRGIQGTDGLQGVQGLTGATAGITYKAGYPNAKTSTGNLGEICIDGANGVMYVCTSTNTWQKVSLNASNFTNTGGFN